MVKKDMALEFIFLIVIQENFIEKDRITKGISSTLYCIVKELV
jgi:hypothetical protein